MVCVLLLVGKNNKDVVKVHDYEMIEILSKNIVHHVLEGCRSVGKAEWHHFVLEMSIVCSKSRFSLIPRLDAHQIIGSPKVNFGEDTPSSETIKECWN